MSIRNDSNEINIEEKSVLEVLSLNLVIPLYQRAYIWKKAVVDSFLLDILRWKEQHSIMRDDCKQRYHLGSIILKIKNNDSYEIVDGQQRLITLAILAKLMNVCDDSNSLVGKDILGGYDAIRRAKEVCIEYAKKFGDTSILEKVVFSVICIQKNAPNEVAYAFFDNTNTLGKRLSDYDLLKTHHLRYVEEKKQRRCADSWKNITTVMLDDVELQHRLLNDCLYRVRNWGKKAVGFPINGDSSDSHLLFKHFSSSVDTSENEVFENYSSIEIENMIVGGVPFFEYVEKYRNLFMNYIKEPSVEMLKAKLYCHSSGVLYKVILAVGFVAYSRFGGKNISEMMATLAYVLSELRNEQPLQERWINGARLGAFINEIVYIVLHAPSDVSMIRILLHRSSYACKKSKTSSVVYRYWKSLEEYLKSISFSVNIGVTSLASKICDFNA